MKNANIYYLFNNVKNKDKEYDVVTDQFVLFSATAIIYDIFVKDAVSFVVHGFYSHTKRFLFMMNCVKNIVENYCWFLKTIVDFVHDFICDLDRNI